MKLEENQSFKTSDALVSLALLGAVTFILGAILLNNIGDGARDFALRDMESLSSQLLAGGLKSLPEAGPLVRQRGLASITTGGLGLAATGGEGRIGKDPWGAAFHYKVLTGQKVGYIVVISGGPDGSIQTDYMAIKSGPNGHLLGAKFAADDVGYIKTFH